MTTMVLHERVAPKLRIVDVINTAAAAKEILVDRVRHFHRPPAIENWIVCSAGDHVELLRAQGLPVAVVDTPRGLEPGALARATWRLTRLFRSLAPDLVHTHSSVSGAVGRVAARAAGVPVVVHTVHGFHFHEGSRLPARLFSWATERALAAFTDMLLTQNREDLQAVRRWRGVRTRLVGNGIDVPRFARLARRHSGPGRVVACIARFEPVKNHHDLLRVFARVRAVCPQARLRLIGDGALRPQYEREAAELGIASATEFAGYREDVSVLLEDVDVAVLLSWKEGIARGLLEPMAAGIPVVAWRVKGNREVVRSGKSGLLAPPGDLEQTTAHIVRLLEDPALRNRLGAAAAERVHRQFNEAAIVARLAEVYASLLGAAGRALPISWEQSHDQRTVLSA
jgi:glycosyltransferase involved in cell wall biosynthesis